jgi:hypothetical protein
MVDGVNTSLPHDAPIVIAPGRQLSMRGWLVKANGKALTDTLAVSFELKKPPRFTMVMLDPMCRPRLLAKAFVEQIRDGRLFRPRPAARSGARDPSAFARHRNVARHERLRSWRETYHSPSLACRNNEGWDEFARPQKYLYWKSNVFFASTPSVDRAITSIVQWPMRNGGRNGTLYARWKRPRPNCVNVMSQSR